MVENGRVMNEDVRAIKGSVISVRAINVGGLGEKVFFDFSLGWQVLTLS